MHCPVHNFSGNKHVRNKIYHKFYISTDLNIQQKEVEFLQLFQCDELDM
jgi:hypothetical protein